MPLQLTVRYRVLYGIEWLRYTEALVDLKSGMKRSSPAVGQGCLNRAELLVYLVELCLYTHGPLQ